MHTHLFLLLSMASTFASAQSSKQPIAWPEGNQVAISLSFDDARPSQVDVGTPLLDKYDVKATFFLVPGSVEQRQAKWKQAAEAGHEMGNHSLNHPCSGNFPWSRQKAIEEYSLEQMREELVQANQQIEALVGVAPEVFAYPCGQTFVGRGRDTKSYVPVVAELFTSGRGWLDESPNDPAFCDMAQLLGMSTDEQDFPAIREIIENAKQNGQWIVFAGHDIGESGRQTTRTAMLEALFQYAENPENGVWLAPIGTVAAHIQNQRTSN
uniref:Polysaccharide deacetylase family protein n=1 Tax=Roseihalotalea indica TaxID=2867963 RepID=A0AA49JET6_9BACT|nr:polysaccharide deacetylase family protein [Tunicatimonas sp. TK19036]